METFDIMAIIAKAMDAGHEVTIEQEGVIVHIKPAAAPEQKEEPKPEPKKQRKAINRKELDMGKVKALRAAGWSFEKIADEMRCAPQTIVNHLKEVES